MKLGLHNLPFIYATLVQVIMIKQLAYIKKTIDLIERKQKN